MNDILKKYISTFSIFNGVNKIFGKFTYPERIELFNEISDGIAGNPVVLETFLKVFDQSKYHIYGFAKPWKYYKVYIDTPDIFDYIIDTLYRREVITVEKSLPLPKISIATGDNELLPFRSYKHNNLIRIQDYDEISEVVEFSRFYLDRCHTTNTCNPYLLASCMFMTMINGCDIATEIFKFLDDNNYIFGTKLPQSNFFMFCRSIQFFDFTDKKFTIAYPPACIPVYPITGVKITRDMIENIKNFIVNVCKYYNVPYYDLEHIPGICEACSDGAFDWNRSATEYIDTCLILATLYPNAIYYIKQYLVFSNEVRGFKGNTVDRCLSYSYSGEPVGFPKESLDRDKFYKIGKLCNIF